MEGVKLSGAPPPRKIIVQQCVRDRGVLEVLCNYVSYYYFFLYPSIILSIVIMSIVNDYAISTVGYSIKELPSSEASCQFLHCRCYRSFGYSYKH